MDELKEGDQSIDPEAGEHKGTSFYDIAGAVWGMRGRGEEIPQELNDLFQRASRRVGYDIATQAFGLDEENARKFSDLYAAHTDAITRIPIDQVPKPEEKPLGRTPEEEALIAFMLETVLAEKK